MMPTASALIFDMDNTLIGSRIDFLAIRRALIALLRSAGATDATDEALTRRAIPELVTCGTDHDRAHGTATAEEMWRIIDAYERAGLVEVDVLDDAPAVLRALGARGHPVAILTNNSRAAALEALRATRLLEYAQTLVARGDVSTLKPAGDGVREVLRRLGSAGERAYVIGDSRIDGAAAADAGARFIAYRRPAEELRQRGVTPWRTVQHLRELLELDLSG